MCGIAGVVGPGAGAHRAAVARMLDAMVHRGPDDEGIWAGEEAVIGARRLAIVDPAGGHQPLVDRADGRVIAANGEIYGYERIRARFADHPYTSGSDLEVIAPLVRAHGEDFLRHLPGTFALAVWDPAARRLVLARDRFGERPLHWARVGDLLVFASEPAALRASGLVAVTVDREVLARTVRQGYVPPDRCIWDGMATLPPASALRLDLASGALDVARWWQPPAIDERAAPADPVAWLRRTLDRAVQDQLVADVPVGTFLSGGLDSSTIASLAARHHPQLAGFAFDMPVDSEVPHARAVADRHGIDLHVLSPGELDVVSGLDDVARTWGEPLADSSTLPTLLLSRFVRQHVTVALTGDGADELFGGYLCWARPMLDPADPARTAPARERWWSRRAPGPPPGTAVARRYADFRAYFTAAELVAMGLPGTSGDDVDVSAYATGTLDDVLRFDLDHYLPGDILVKTDRASMAASLEVRAPFLDVEVAEGVLRLPPRWKVDHRSEKVLLREAFADLLPRAVLERPKQGFGSPMDRWLAAAGVEALVERELRDPAAPVFELLDRDGVRPHLDARGQQLWTLLSVALWWRHHRAGAAARR